MFACTFGGALAGIWLRSALPEHHISDQSKDSVKVAVGLIATMAALVLGLVTASAKSSFDELNTAVKQTSAAILTLDRTLARYGPEAKPIRDGLKHAVGQRLELTWPKDASRPANLDLVETGQGGEALADAIRALVSRDDEQRRLQSRAIDQAEALLQARWVVVGAMSSSVPVAFLSVLVFWLTIIFSSFGLFAPRNATVVGALLVCALSVAGAIFLILEMDSPFDGVIRISPDPMRYAYSRINQ